MKKKYSILSAVLLSSTLLMSTAALADDDRDEKYEDHEREDNYEDYEDYEYEGNDEDYEDYEGENDEDYEDDYEESGYYEQGGYTNYTTVTQPVTPASTWNIWTRETVNTKGNLPFTEAKTVTMKRANSTATIKSYVVPRDGEIFVPAQDVAGFLNADATYYPTSTILEVKSATAELVFRANTNVVYENNTKTPLPASAFTMNDTVYVPISALTNGLGYTVEWQEVSNSFVYTQQ